MTTARDPLIDRSGWPQGPWDDEPDQILWTDQATGLPCLIMRSSNFGMLCGYVGVDRAHPFYGKDYHDVDDVDVHGGLTYAGDDREPSASDVWWFGFDCGHAFDVLPAMIAMGQEYGVPGYDGRDWPGMPDVTYKTVDYVRGQCEVLARFLAEAAE